MLRKFLFVAALAMFAVPAQAGVYGSALITTSNMRVQRSDTAGGTFTDIGLPGVNITTTTLGLRNTVNLTGFSQLQLADSSNDPLSPPDAAQAFLQTGGVIPPGENTFATTTPVAGLATAFSRSDTNATGSLVSPGGLNLSSVSEVEAVDSSLGNSIGSSTGFALFDFTVAQSGYYRIIFDANVEATVSSLGLPANRIATAGTSLTIQVNSGGISLNDSNLLNVALSGNDSVSQDLDDLITGTVFLEANVNHQITISQISRASVAAVPEPGTMLAFAGIVVAGGIGFRRRKRS
ncbi:PEP-CTERM sorting domain-containing protein [Allorhodopirellula heiligendammensis]|uniref:Ice-binding protein C-terminal domain-containing protein n=1 Tax=Allorhodopirellula heiligendammensis TaxID=2714739 RepID=A0A5C6C9D8_9BACT|nr:PEP-CTERM sorting domain-containing protein [Allorhodopirellula heiligendammensis]TWU19984.1 hypothetical protein Poly21_21630 [Allorhodopirellula heiligendammensis]